MKTGTCRCGNRIFFANVQCVGCEATLGRCNECKSLASFSAKTDGWQCDLCDAVVQSCNNRSRGACNSLNAATGTYCRWCEFTTTVPNLQVPQNVPRWAALEAAKRRVLLELESLGLPPFAGSIGQAYPLRFQFLEDSVGQSGRLETTMTGHEQGLITINLQEADSVQRERLRVQFGEPQRTLIGHIRHEVGHYIDWSLASRVTADEYRQLFGNPHAIDYQQALRTYYEQGAPADWETKFVSQYAAAHPWEDFAETVNLYLDLMAIAVTANDQDLGKLGLGTLDLDFTSDAEQLVLAVLKVVVMVSEFNYDLGLPPLLPERLSPAVMDKLRFVHSLRNPALIDVPALSS